MGTVLKTIQVPLDKLTPYPANPRQGDVGAIIESLRAHGQYRALVVNQRNGQVLAGNHTLEALREMGEAKALVHYVDVDDDEATRIVLVDNRSNDLASYDDMALLDLLRSLPDLDGTGYDAGDLDDLSHLFEPNGGGRQGEDTPPGEPPAEPITQAGDLIIMGTHRLLCGDSTRPDHLQRLLEGARPHLLYTDPPYGMSYRGTNFQVIQGDNLRGDALETLVQDALALGAQHLQPGAATYVWCTWRTYPEFAQAIRTAGLEPTACIVWNKGRIGPGAMHYRPAHEFCMYCAPNHEGDHDLCVYCKGNTWNGRRGHSDVWDVPRDQNYVHPTQKPTALAETALVNSTSLGDLVLDLFGGSESTLIAAENLGRSARLMELDPGYCDVIVDRWERHTGRTAVRTTTDQDTSADGTLN